MLVQKLFDPKVGLFRLTSNKLYIDINPNSAIVPRHYEYLELAGIVLGKAFLADVTLDINISKPLIKQILGLKVDPEDLREIDGEMHKTLTWMLSNDVTGTNLYFTVDSIVLGERVTKELIPGGAQIEVTEANKMEFYNKAVEYLLNGCIENQLKAFIRGFRTIVPLKWISFLTPQELEVLISGSGDINIEVLKKNTIYKGHSKNSEVVTWLWEFLSELKENDLLNFFYFLTGNFYH